MSLAALGMHCLTASCFFLSISAAPFSFFFAFMAFAFSSALAFCSATDRKGERPPELGLPGTEGAALMLAVGAQREELSTVVTEDHADRASKESEVQWGRIVVVESEGERGQHSTAQDAKQKRAMAVSSVSPPVLAAPRLATQFASLSTPLSGCSAWVGASAGHRAKAQCKRSATAGR
jgi:hypothetical protein